MENIVTPTQCRMARAALGWTLKDLSTRADVSISTANHYEKSRHVHEKSVESIKAALEESNEIQFVTDQGVFHIKKKRQRNIIINDVTIMGDYNFVEDETMKPIKIALGLRIRSLREERHISQQSLCASTDVNKSYIYLLERGLANPTLLILTKIAYTLKVDVVDLLSDTD